MHQPGWKPSDPERTVPGASPPARCPNMVANSAPGAHEVDTPTTSWTDRPASEPREPAFPKG